MNIGRTIEIITIKPVTTPKTEPMPAAAPIHVPEWPTRKDAPVLPAKK